MRLIMRTTVIALLASVLLLGVSATAFAIGPGDSNIVGETNANGHTVGENSHPGDAQRCAATLAVITGLLDSGVAANLDPALVLEIILFYNDECDPDIPVG